MVAVTSMVGCGWSSTTVASEKRESMEQSWSLSRLKVVST
jgi:hypothetical protein